jgi:hypothetical protein
MATAKDLRVAPIAAKDAVALIRRVHYSGKVVQNSQLHLGVFLDGRLEGAMSFGPSLDKRKVVGLVKDTGWNGFIELNRMAFSEALPRNSESRALSVAFRLIRKNYPQIEGGVSFSDATQCGDGTIYRASGFVLTGMVVSKNLVRLPCGVVVHKMTLESSPTQARPELGGRSYYEITGGRYNLQKYLEVTGAEVIPGYQMRYMYFINPEARQRLTVPEIGFDMIEKAGAGMYKGKKITRTKEQDAGNPPALGGVTPTCALHSISDSP